MQVSSGYHAVSGEAFRLRQDIIAFFGCEYFFQTLSQDLPSAQHSEFSEYILRDSYQPDAAIQKSLQSAGRPNPPQYMTMDFEMQSIDIF